MYMYITYPVRYSVYFAGFNETALAFIWSGTSGPVISIIVHHSCPIFTLSLGSIRNKRNTEYDIIQREGWSSFSYKRS